MRKVMVRCLLVVACLLLTGYLRADVEQKPMVVVIPSYNNERWCKKNLESVFAQNYENYRVIYIDDCSADHTHEFVNYLITEHNQRDRFILIRNETRRGALANHFHAVHGCKDTEIIVHLDGDDWFAHENVLARVNQEYQDPDVWLTYGQFALPNGSVGGCCRPFKKEVIARNAYRDAPCYASHLRTFYAWLFKRIKKEDLLYKGDFFSMTCDWAMMFPMLEMSGGRFAFIRDVLYIYNMSNPLNDFRVDYKLQSVIGRFIQKKKRYQPLEQGSV